MTSLELPISSARKAALLTVAEIHAEARKRFLELEAMRRGLPTK